MHPHWRFLSVLYAGLVLSCLIPATTQAQSSWEGPTRLSSNIFVDATRQATLSSKESAMSIAWVDWGQDGWPDLWLGRHGDTVPGKLFINQQDGTFGSDIVPEITSPYDEKRDQHGALWTDLDNDGDQDLIIATGANLGQGAEPNLVFRTEGIGAPSYGSLVLQEATGLEYEHGRGRMPMALDYDGDGLIDVIPTTDLRPGATLAERAPTRLFRQDSNTNGTFAFLDMSTETEFLIDTSSDFAQLADLSGDHVPDLLIHGSTFPARIYDLTTVPFKDLADQLMPQRYFRVKDAAIADFNGDLHPDLFLCRRYLYSDWAQAGDSLLAMRLRVSTNPNVALDHGGARVRTSGPIRIRTDGPYGRLAPRDHIYIGGQGHHPSSSRDIMLDNTSEDNYGLVDPDTLSHSGHALLVGYDTTEAAWTVKLTALSGSTNQTIIVSTPESTIEDFSPIGEAEEAHSGVLLLFDPDEDRFARKRSGAPGRFSCTNVAAGDFDNDGDVDLYLANTGTLRSHPNALFENDGQGNFRKVSDGGGAAGKSSTVFGGNVLNISARAVVADYDRDGFLDLFTPGSSSIKALGDPILDGNGEPAFEPAPAQLFRNQGASILPGSESHYVSIDLVGRHSNRDAVGARVLVYADGTGQLRERDSGTRHFAQDSKRLHFGLGASTHIDSMIVHWPSGNVQRLTDLPVDQTHVVTEIDNAPPVAQDDEAETHEDKAVEIAVLSNDTDVDGDTLFVAEVGSPSHGTASATDPGAIVYRPGEDFVGQDAFEYVLQDGQGARSRASVTVNVLEAPTVMLDVNFDADWNLTGVPLDAKDTTYQVLFSDISVSNGPLSFNEKYVTESTLVPGEGYWLEVEANEAQAIRGKPINRLPLDLRQGWNLISGPNCELPVEKIDDAGRITPSTLYSYNGGYAQSDTLYPGKGYWLHARTASSVTLDCNAASSGGSQEARQSHALTTEDFGRLIVRSGASYQQVLYFGAKLEEIPTASSKMPPMPPEGAFDVRFEGDYHFIEDQNGFIALRSPIYPVTITLDTPPQGTASQVYVLEELVNGEVVGQHKMQRGSTVRINDPSVKQLRLQAEADRPDAFALHGNYPNPFQTATTIVVDLPESAKISIAVFDVLGRRVMNLPEQTVYAGSERTLSLDATQLAAGSYFYRVQAEMPSGTATEIGRMIVAK